MLHWCNGNATGFQPVVKGSIPLCSSKFLGDGTARGGRRTCNADVQIDSNSIFSTRIYLSSVMGELSRFYSKNYE